MSKIKITNDEFMWLILNKEAAMDAWETNRLELFKLYDDGSEASIETKQDLDDALKRGLQVGVEIGFKGETDILHICPHCHAALLPSCTKGYDYQCILCDEDFYDFETNRVVED